ncbi:PREDICTED: uncharacterized protein LOC104825614 [Tarenaya hassleriana]|uniref:uncharacterized protein LOC104825614 n=1 Tax=Tarenaya hassleriana TaxID=28532 RepID=UPI00053C343D|nr:PREDICTED: uncharacterized protein LOC104825614 [Tarenaya hassleriana]
MVRFSVSGGGNGEESSDRRSWKRLKRASIVENEAEITGNPNAGSSREGEDERRRSSISDGHVEDEEEGELNDRASSGNDRDGEEATPEGKSVNGGESPLTVMLTDPDVLDCAVCYEPLKSPIFQCDNGHIACASCCTKSRHKCPSCTMPIGYFRCRAMERVIESIRLPCPNAKQGCTKKFVYGEGSSHVKECLFIPCSCPALDCNFMGSYKQLNTHFRDEHRNILRKISRGKEEYVCLSINDNETEVFEEEKEGVLIVIQSFLVANDLRVSVSCIAPPVRGVGEFSYTLETRLEGEGETTLTFDSKMRNIQEVSMEPPVECFMLIPSYMFYGIGSKGVKTVRICISRSGETSGHCEQVVALSSEDCRWLKVEPPFLEPSMATVIVRPERSRDFKEEGEEQEDEDGDAGEDEETPNRRREDENETRVGEEATPEGKSVNGGESSLAVTLTEPDVLDCGVCYEPLGIPIFQCDSGHIACASCCTKLRHKCPSCAMPIGNYRCRAMERLLETIRLPCPNTRYGCKKILAYGERSSHGKECLFISCTCPVLGCNFSGPYKQLTSHFRDEHSRSLKGISCGKPEYTCLSINHNEMKVFEEEKEGELVVLQSFPVANDLRVSVSCISPLVRGVGEFSYNLETSILDGERETILTFDSKMKKIQKVSIDPPDAGFMLVPTYMFYGRKGVKTVRLCISRG